MAFLLCLRRELRQLTVIPQGMSNTRQRGKRSSWFVFVHMHDTSEGAFCSPLSITEVEAQRLKWLNEGSLFLCPIRQTL